jgi:regulator of sirC expression with transglutaminase-like and TPR domain
VNPAQPCSEQQAALLALLDDTQPSVRRALLAYFQQQGPAAARFLQEIAAGSNRILAWHAHWYLDELHFSDPISEFKDFIRSLNHDLEAGALLLCRVRNPHADVDACLAQLDEMARRCRELMVEPMTVREKCRVINRVLFGEFGLHGNQDHYSDPLNSFLDQVLLRRRGIPITLCLVYLLVARRLGLNFEPIGYPGHFLLGCFTEDPIFFIDAFENGTFHSYEGIPTMLASPINPPKPSDLAPIPVREMLCRCCRNLVLHYAAAGEGEHSRTFAEFVEEFEATYDRTRF